MYAVEFKAKIVNGVIEVPQNYITNLGEEVKVILLKEDEVKNDDIITKLLTSPITVKEINVKSRGDLYE